MSDGEHLGAGDLEGNAGAEVVPRGRGNRLPRHRVTSPSVGDERAACTCPRCGWPCRHVWPVYWDSPWNAHGGLCGQCAQEAAVRFDEIGWPPASPEGR